MNKKIKFNNEIHNKSTNTIKSYNNGVNKFLNFNKNQKINEKTIQKFINEYKKIYKPSTINLYIASVKRYCEIEKHKINWKNISQPKTYNNIAPKVISKKQMKYIKSSIKDSKYKVIYYLFSELGIRRSEAFNLRHCDIKWEENKIYIMNAKGNKYRILPLTQKIKKSMQKYKEVNNSNERYFIDIKQPEMINHYFKKIDNSITPHMFRHTCITNLIYISKTDLITVQAISGHSSIETLKIYFKPTITHLLEAIEKLKNP